MLCIYVRCVMYIVRCRQYRAMCLAEQVYEIVWFLVNRLKANCRELNSQSVPRSKHTASGLYKPVS